ncbi:MAG TPA: hypothetical protein EYO94_02005, partial [Acidobacteria bacterium]|nr:hypothetical protein [Acidobacteriota bacterium]
MTNRRQVCELTRSAWLPLIMAVTGSLFALSRDVDAAEPPAPLTEAAATATDVAATINRYCLSCHN